MKKEFDRVELMLDYLRGNLSIEDHLKVEALIDGDQDSAGLFSVVKELFSEGQKSDFYQMRDSALRMASRMFDDFQMSRKQTNVGRGITVYDSMMLPLPGDVRPAKVDTRRLRYKVGELDLQISLYPISIDSYEMIGQLFDWESAEPLSVRLRSQKHEFREKADRFNLFRFVRIPVSNYILDLICSKKRIGTVALEL